jgi:hypothetical protein
MLVRMVGALVVVGIVVVLVVGFWLTRGSGGLGPVSGESRKVDLESRYGPLGKPMPRADDEMKRPE